MTSTARPNPAPSIALVGAQYIVPFFGFDSTSIHSLEGARGTCPDPVGIMTPFAQPQNFTHSTGLLTTHYSLLTVLTP